MVKKVLILTVLSVVLIFPAEAVAKTKHYKGTIGPSGTISFKIVQKKHSKEKRVTGFSFFGLPVNCAEGTQTTRGIVSSTAKLKRGNFKLVALNNITRATLKVRGNLSAGTIHLTGNLPIDPSGTGTNCDSGVLSWTAHRG